jgi:hypothetical protein
MDLVARGALGRLSRNKIAVAGRYGSAGATTGSAAGRRSGCGAVFGVSRRSACFVGGAGVSRGARPSLEARRRHSSRAGVTRSGTWFAAQIA